MIADALQRFQAGDGLGTLRADTMNALIDSAKIVRRKFGSGQMGGRFVSHRPERGALEILIRNDTGSTLTERTCVQVSYPLPIPAIYTLEMQERPAFSGITPTSTSGTPAVLIDPIPDGEVGRAVIMGVAMVSVNITDAAHTRATLTSASTAYLTSGTSGPATILWRETGTGVKLCAVLLCCTTGVPAVGDDEENWEYLPDGDAASVTSCVPCGGEVALPLAWLNFTNKTGAATCLPDSIPLTRVPAGDMLGWGDAVGHPGWVPLGTDVLFSGIFGDYHYCTDRTDGVQIWVECGDSGLDVFYIGYTGSDGVLAVGPLNGIAGADEAACDVFATPGALPLGTITHAGPLPAAASFDLELSWE